MDVFGLGGLRSRPMPSSFTDVKKGRSRNCVGLGSFGEG